MLYRSVIDILTCKGSFMQQFRPSAKHACCSLFAEMGTLCRLWSVAHSTLTPHLVACASDNGIVRLWGGRGMASCVASLIPSHSAPVCGVAFSSLDKHLIAAASADANVYLFDLRQTGKPLQVRGLCLCLIQSQSCTFSMYDLMAASG